MGSTPSECHKQLLEAINESRYLLLFSFMLTSFCSLFLFVQLDYYVGSTVPYHVRFKIACISFKAIHLHTPQYLHDLLHWYTPVRTLRSANKNLQAVPSSRTILADRAFSRAAPTVWNALPSSVTSVNTIQKSSQNPFISAGPRHIIRKSVPLNLVLFPRIMALHKFIYLLTYLLTFV